MMGHVSVRALPSCDIWLLTVDVVQPPVRRQANHVRSWGKKKKGLKTRKGRATRRGPQTRQAAAGKLPQSVINEPTGRWDYMPNCTANQSIPK